MRVLSFAIMSCIVTFAAAAAESMKPYNVVWESPSKLPSGAMPLGNGDIAASVYAIEDGDLYLLLAKNDAYTYCGDIFKTGRVRVSLNPNPFTKGKTFKQTLDLDTGSIIIEADGVSIRIWADANRPVYHVEVDSPHEITVSAAADLFKRFDSTAYNVTRAPIKNPTQDVRADRNGNIIWYYHVGDRSLYPADLKYYEVEHMADKFADPYRFNTFGNLVESPNLKYSGDKLTGKGKTFDIRIHSLTMKAPKVETWIKQIESQAAKLGDVKTDWKAHLKWWSEFWGRSWIVANSNNIPAELRGKLSSEGTNGKRFDKDTGALVAQNYNVFRFLMACQSRGTVQTKFNGGLFTQQLHLPKGDRHRRQMNRKLPDGTQLSHEDSRLWGRRFTFQNQRLLYWPCLMAGDTDLMKPFFNYYWNMLPMRTAITKAWFGHEGTYYRENMEPTGAERDCGRSGKPLKVKPGQNKGQGYYHSFYFTCGLETTAMMIDYVNYTGDAKFRDEVLTPFAREILLFFDKHYPRDPDGKLRIDPDMALETWWVAVNSAPDVSGLLYCLDNLLEMKAGTSKDKATWKKFRAEIPNVHLHEINGRKAIAPAREWTKKHNAENGELYPVFPFRRFGLALGTADIVDWTMQHRTNKDAFNHKCWTQDQIHWAYSGNAAEAQDGLIHRYQHASRKCRFPLYGSEGPDSCPDFDHFGSGSTALQRMLVQQGRGKIHLLPAWPANWDVDFKLHLERKTIITGTVKDGKLLNWDVQPASRKKDVVVHEPQAVKAPEVSEAPANNHPLKIGVDQSGKNKFRGKIGRVSAFRGVLKPNEIKALAKGDRTKPARDKNVIKSVVDPKAGDVFPLDPKALKLDVSFEFWIKPVKGENARILDKVTPGKNNGLLIDTWPGLSIRTIVGPTVNNHSDVLQADVWQHVVVAVHGGTAEVYVDGKRR